MIGVRGMSTNMKPGANVQSPNAQINAATQTHQQPAKLSHLRLNFKDFNTKLPLIK